MIMKRQAIRSVATQTPIMIGYCWYLQNVNRDNHNYWETHGVRVVNATL